MFVYSRV